MSPRIRRDPPDPAALLTSLGAPQDVAKEVLAFAEMTSDAPVAPQPDAYDFPDLPSAPEYDPFCGSPVLAALPNGAVSPYRRAAEPAPVVYGSTAIPDRPWHTSPLCTCALAGGCLLRMRSRSCAC